MVMADSFVRSQTARDLEFQYCAPDQPVVVQFAATNARDFADAAALVAPFVDGVDLNCGCPQGWAAQEGIGAVLMRDPQRVKDMLLQARNCTDGTPVSVKMRVFADVAETVELARVLEAAGAAWLTVHGRTRHQKSSEPPSYDAIARVKEAVRIPVVANGDVFSLADAAAIAAETRVDGVMAARGLLENPALFAGCAATPWPCVQRFLAHSVAYGTNSAIFHHHIAKMAATLLSPADLRLWNALSNASMPTLIDCLRELHAKYTGP